MQRGEREPIRTEVQAEDWLEGLINVEKRPDLPYRRLDLAPVRDLLGRLGDPQRGLSIVHVGGSKGKGSTLLLAESVLRASGVRVGTFTSPHLERWTERFRIDGREVEGARLAAAVERLRPHVEELREVDPERAPSFFDATTAAALLLFREAGVERVLLEVGLGGRLDSTNVVTPAVACLTSVELEHTDRLGSTIEAIAREKVGIVKPGAPVVAGDLPSEARDILRARAEELGTSVAWLGRDFQVEVLEESAEGLSLRFADGGCELETRLPVLGAHQARNAALALACLRRAGGLSDARLAGAAVRGLATARLPGRAELLRRTPWILVDAAHTAASARALAHVIERIPRRRTRLVLSISSDKDTASILAALLPGASEVTVTRAEPTRSMSPMAVAAAVRGAAPSVRVAVLPNPHLAIRAARAGLAADDLLCVTGSVYLAGIARRVLRDSRLEAERTSRRGERSFVADP